MAISPDEASFALLEIFILLAVAHLFGAIVQRLGLPRVVGELLAGMVIGSYALGGIFNDLLGIPLFVINDFVLLFADFAVILLIFGAGLEGGLSALRTGGVWIVGAAVAGDLVPFGVTFLIFSPFYPVPTALLLGVAAAATSTAVVAAFVQTEGIRATAPGRFLITAAAIDDVVALILLSVVLTLRGGSSDLLKISGGIAYTSVVWVVVLVASVLVIPRVFRLRAVRESSDAPLVTLFLLVVAVGALGFSALVGAFIAGLAVAESLAAPKARENVEVLLLTFGALFFVVLGSQFNVSYLLQPRVLALAAVLMGVASLGKVAGIYPFARARFASGRTARAIAVALIPRGEIGLIVGAVGLSVGAFDQTLLGAILLMSMFTTVLGALLFRELKSGIHAVPPEESG
ncbi:MAG TPA: cation:proton antiporter [Thermoplasmata archaeon]